MGTNTKLNDEAPPANRKCVPWRKRTHLERYLIVICVVMFIAFVSMIAVVLYLDHIYTRPEPSICNTPVCRRRAGRIMSLMDFDVDPCEDFYNFSCGFFDIAMPSPTTMDRYGAFAIAEERMLRICEDVLEAKGDEDEPDFIKKVRTYYKACLNIETETSVLIGQILNVSGIYRWPILEHDYYDEHQLVEKTMALIEVNGGFNGFFSAYYSMNDTERKITMYPGYVFGMWEMFTNDTDETWIRRKGEYRSLLTYSFFKAGTQLEAIKSEVEELIEFETILANITSKHDKEENVTETTLIELEEQCKGIGLMQVMKHLFDYFGRSDDYYDEITVKIISKTYIDYVCKLFKRSSRRILYNYMVWRFLAGQLQEFDLYFGKASQNMIGEEDTTPLSKSRLCIRNMKHTSFIHGLNYMVLNHLDPDKSVEEVNKFSDQIRETMDHMFSVESWLDEDGKKIARERLANISAAIGYSKESLDPGFVEEVFRNVNVTESHIENSFREERRRIRHLWFNNTSSSHREMIIRYPLEVAAFFMGEHVVLSFGVLQPPFYEYGSPKYVNFAVTAFVIAHEFSHAFDSLDLENSQDNRTDGAEQWSEEVIEAFKQRKECYVNQYFQYPLTDNGTMVDGNGTIRDNIADNSGVVQAFTAYEKYYLSDSEEPGLPGLDFTNEELFFINYAQSWCETLRDPEKVFEYDSHSPGRYRVIGPLQNFPRFAEVFKCPLGSPMNPKEKCRMWG